MSIPILTLFNNKSGVGKTSLIYHLAWMFAILEKRVMVADLDPQANLTAALLDEDTINELLTSHPSPGRGFTIYQCVNPLMDAGDIASAELQKITSGLYLLPGDIALSGYEDILSAEWSNSLRENNLYRPMRMLSSFWQVCQNAAEQVQADIILVDIGPNLGAINRSVLISTDYVIIPLGTDIFSLQGLKSLGPALKEWKKSWGKRLANWQGSKEKSAYPDFQLPEGNMQTLGYLCQQCGLRLERPIRVYDRWVQQIPQVYRSAVLENYDNTPVRYEADPYCIATIKHYRGLTSIAQERRKPIFNLTPADGAIASLAIAVQSAKSDYKSLAKKIAGLMGINV
jgi:cellulose biosynthesis protein BcsQ